MNHVNLLHTAACDLFGCEYPIVLAGMGGVSRSSLVAAVINAGGYGFLGMVRESPDLIRTEIRRVRNMSGREFGVNLIPAATDPELIEQQIKVCIEEQVDSVCLFWDVYPDIIQQLLEAGILVVHQIGSCDDARAALEAGVHALIVQGVEAGGHVRGTLPLLELLDRVLRMTRLPVLAAGGIVSGDDMARILRRGAHGAVIGTALLATDESFAHDYHKRRIIKVKEDESILTNLFHINWPYGALTRVLPNSVTRLGGVESPGEDHRTVIGECEGNPVYLYSTDSPLQTTSGRLEAMPAYAGCGAGRIRQQVSAHRRVQDIVTEAAVALGNDGFVNADHDVTESSSSARFIKVTDDSNTAAGEVGELAGILNEMLTAERAGARVTLRSMMECNDKVYSDLFALIYADESRWCKLLAEWISRLGHIPSSDTGDLYHRAMAIEDMDARIRFLNRGQSRVVKKLNSILAGINMPHLQEDLQDMLTCHLTNITLANKHLGSI